MAAVRAEGDGAWGLDGGSGQRRFLKCKSCLSQEVMSGSSLQKSGSEKGQEMSEANGMISAFGKWTSIVAHRRALRPDSLGSDPDSAAWR